MRFNFALMMTVISYSIASTYSWPSKSFHDIITQPEPNGKYVRSTLKDQFPRHWSHISKDLHSLGFNFREMNEYNNKTEMPDVINKWDNSWY
jgi:hypothetical protein